MTLTPLIFTKSQVRGGGKRQTEPNQLSRGNVLIELIQYRDMKVPLVTITSQNQDNYSRTNTNEMTCYPSCHWSSVGDFAENQVIGKYFKN